MKTPLQSRPTAWCAPLAITLTCAVGAAADPDSTAPPFSPSKTVAVPAVELSAAIDRLILQRTRGRFWGQVTVIRHGQVMFSRGYGLADHDRGPISGLSVFDIGSLAKQFTAAALLKLAEQRKVALDDPIRTLVPTLAPVSGGDVTLRQLLSHTSGLPPEIRFTPDTLTRADALLTLALDPKSPGRGEAGVFRYSNVNYFVAAALIENASGRSFEEYLRDELFLPSGMTRTGFVGSLVPPRDLLTARVSGRGAQGHGSRADEYPWNWGQRGATGVLTCAADLAAWDTALRDGHVLSAATRADFFQPVSRAYALGWEVERAGDDDQAPIVALRHGGSTGGYTCSMMRRLDEHAAVIVLTDERGRAADIERAISEALWPRPRRPPTAIIGLRPYTADRAGVVNIPRDLTLVVMPEYRGSMPDGSVLVDRRPTIVLQDAGRAFWPLIIRLDATDAATLAKSIGEGQPADAGPAAPTPTTIRLKVFTEGRVSNEHGVLILPDDLRVRLDTNHRADRTGAVLLHVECPLGAIATATLDRSSARRMAEELRALTPAISIVGEPGGSPE